MKKQYDSAEQKRLKIGPTMQKILLLLGGGLALGLSGRPDKHFRIMRGMAKEWNSINRRALYDAIRKLYRSKMVSYTEKDGITAMVLSENGKNKVLEYNLEKMKIRKPDQWDKVWRMVIFDVPEDFKRGRNALAAKLKQLGFYLMQKSVFIYPYACKNEVDFIVEIFGLRPYVRFLLVKETDIDLDLKHRFKMR